MKLLSVHCLNIYSLLGVKRNLPMGREKSQDGLGLKIGESNLGNLMQKVDETSLSTLSQHILTVGGREKLADGKGEKLGRVGFENWRK